MLEYAKNNEKSCKICASNLKFKTYLLKQTFLFLVNFMYGDFL